MTQETTQRFSDAINAQIDYFRREYELTYAEAIGTLYIIATGLVHEYDEEEDDGLTERD